MKKIILLLLLSHSIYAEKINVMTYNTMCDFCNGSDFFKYEGRINQISKKIKKLEPDIIGLQEVRLKSQIESILVPFKKYEFITLSNSLLSYADPTIIYNKLKFKLIESEYYWLGPREGSFSLGWKFALPRLAIKARFKSIKTNREFYFFTSHFDNRIENINGSTKMISKMIKNIKIPVIFAADTNITVDMPQYKNFVNNLFINAFDVKAQLTVIGNYKDEKELCYTRKGKKFPECRVDHILLSQNSSWKVYQYLIDAEKNDNNSYTSDHRAVMAIIELI